MYEKENLSLPLICHFFPIDVTGNVSLSADFIKMSSDDFCVSEYELILSTFSRNCNNVQSITLTFSVQTKDFILSKGPVIKLKGTSNAN